MSYNFNILDEELQKAIDWFFAEIASLRTGRATPALVENIKIKSYGADTPLQHISAIHAEDAKTILIKPWDRGNIKAIESAIRASNLGLQPVVDQDTIRIILPDLTEERKISLIKLLKEKLEQARITVRQSRDEIWSDIQEKEKSGEISEDEKFRLKDDMQKKIDDAIKKLEDIASKKEKEINS